MAPGGFENHTEWLKRQLDSVKQQIENLQGWKQKLAEEIRQRELHV